ncbi:DNA polymerase Y family protein [Niveibacterium sp. 24ML]|uniref:Y-family DNA polymerase n=1 Tax=Niveibacterium sp. 24ML TaxID=2985512 RepID=UPI00226EDAA1|nr:DNA polymerase Y family protein [Niveibacterium sp. 24ML]MCX9155337.1 DNA polymerase Y family protein [Niveibacterium sp. 24ML]
MLWLALQLFRLPIEVFAARPPAVAVARGRVLSTDAQAEAAGVQPGQKLSSALGLAPQLSACERDPQREAAVLMRLACWAGRFSPQVSLAPPDELLIEIGGSLRLFKGLEALLQAVEAGLTAEGYSYRIGLARTPLAAQWFARAALTGYETHASAEAARLAGLPLGVIGFDERAARRLAVLGLTHIGELLALPQAALARRFGPDLPLQLAQARGDLPDLRRSFAFPERFSEYLELPARVELAPMLLFGARRLLQALAGWLNARGAGLQQCVLQLEHEDIDDSQLVLGFAAPTRDADRLARVLRERLDRLALTAPVVGLRLVAEQIESMPGESAALFGEAGTQRIAPVVERLRARLGREAVHGIAVQPGHRPEHCTVAVDWPRADAPDAARSRPLWLLREACPLVEQDGRPQHKGPLQLLTRPERIESGWWDAGEGLGDVRRDYHVALSSRGEWLWIYRDTAGWWLQGVFG